jgi:hypothetical protein
VSRDWSKAAMSAHRAPLVPPGALCAPVRMSLRVPPSSHAYILRQNPALWTRRYTMGLFVTKTGVRLLYEPLTG